MENEKSVCQICGETQEDWDDSVDWTCPNLCTEVSDGEIYSKISLLDRLKQDVADANDFIKEIGELLVIDTDNWGKDGITASVDDFKDAIGVLIKKEREEERKETWDNIKEIYDTTDYKKYIEEAEKRVAQDFVMQCFEADNGNHIISTCELEKLKERYGINDTNTD
jgi:hypothetical protein